MRQFLDIAQTGLAAVFLHPMRSAVCVCALVAVLLPYLTAMAVYKGIEREAENSIGFGADLYVTGRQFGRTAPVPLEAAGSIRHLDGVTRVVPRIIGEVHLGREQVSAIVVGISPEDLGEWSASVEGELPRARSPHELVVGSTLASRLNLQIGSVLPPFYRNEKGERLSMVVGVFRRDAPLWQANLILTTFDFAQEIFDQTGFATDFLVWCVPEARTSAVRTIEQEVLTSPINGTLKTRLHVTAREDLRALMPRAMLHREGVLHTNYLAAIVVGILTLLVASGAGLTERRREIGILKAIGWHTDQLLLRDLVESTVLSLIGSCSAILLAWLWLRVFNGCGIVGLLLPGAGAAPAFQVPFRLSPVPLFVTVALSFVIVLTGTLYSVWRAAGAPPSDAMR